MAHTTTNSKHHVDGYNGRTGSGTHHGGDGGQFISGNIKNQLGKGAPAPTGVPSVTSADLSQACLVKSQTRNPISGWHNDVPYGRTITTVAGDLCERTGPAGNVSSVYVEKPVSFKEGYHSGSTHDLYGKWGLDQSTVVPNRPIFLPERVTEPVRYHYPAATHNLFGTNTICATPQVERWSECNTTGNYMQLNPFHPKVKGGTHPEMSGSRSIQTGGYYDFTRNHRVNGVRDTPPTQYSVQHESKPGMRFASYNNK